MIKCYYLRRNSGVTDHFAQNDEHALTIARSIVANLNWRNTSNTYKVKNINIFSFLIIPTDFVYLNHLVKSCFIN